MPRPIDFLAIGLSILLVGGWASRLYGATYLTMEQALALAFENPADARRQALILDAKHRRTVEEKLGEKVPQRGILTYAGRLKSSGVSGVALFDAVIGKHELIDYMVVLDSTGRVVFVEILAYRESQGGTIRNQGWRDQFRGRSAQDPPAHEKNIANLSGATLSCRHVTEGVRKVLAIADAYANELGIQAEK